MTQPFYVSPQQLMEDRADFARKGIARGRSVVVLGYTGGILLATENPSRALHKISEIYDRIGFAAVGKYNEFENLRVAGVRYGDLRGYSYDREDVNARGLANAYAQTLGAVFTTESKPLEVELAVAEVGTDQSTDQLYRLAYDGSVADEPGFVVMGGAADKLAERVRARWTPGMSLPEVLALAVQVLSGTGKDARTINSCLRIGTVIALLCYVVWIAAADGIIPRDDFKHITNVGDLVAASGTSLGGIILKMLEAFALFAIATSFLGAGLGLFDYMADLCGFDNSRLGRTKTMLITFVPPMIGGIIWPDGFLPAIGWAGLAASIWSVIVPALLLRASRRKFQASLYRVPGGSTTVPLLLVYGIIVAVCHTLYVFNLLPVFK